MRMLRRKARGNAKLLLAALAAVCLGGLLFEADSSSRGTVRAGQAGATTFQFMNALVDPLMSRLADRRESGCRYSGPRYNRKGDVSSRARSITTTQHCGGGGLRAWLGLSRSSAAAAIGHGE